MEHQILPHGASYGEESLIPYIGSEDYLGIPFLQYPEHVGYTFLHQHDSRIWVDLGQVARESPSPEFLQTWLIYGLLQEMLGQTLEEFTWISLYNHGDFVRSSKKIVASHGEIEGTDGANACATGVTVVTTARLNEFLEQWSGLVRPKVDTAEFLFSHLALCLTSVAAPVIGIVGPKLHSKLAQCLCSIVELLGLVLDDVFRKQTYVRGKHCIPHFADLVWTEEKVAQMQFRGWCPFQAYQLAKSYPFLQSLLYIERLEKPKPSVREIRHRGCDFLECGAYQMPDQPQHRRSDCQCNSITLSTKNWASLRLILDSEKVPVLRLSIDDDIVMMSVAASEPTVGYIALSHVWADGLGNKNSNSLPTCQIDYIYHRAKRIQRGLGNDSTDVYVWIDTVLCPLEPDLQRKALALMGETYRNAAAVLVLDAELESTDLTSLNHLEILTRISCSTWMRRLWCFQEAFLAKSLWVQFYSEPVNMDQMMEEPEDIETKFLQKYIYRSVKSKLMCSRKSQFQPVLTRTQFGLIVGNGIQGRFVSVASDESLCLCTLFDLDVAKVTCKPAESRMQEFWRLLSEGNFQIPSAVLFSRSPRLPELGYRWAPSTIIDPDTSTLIARIEGTGRLSTAGLIVNLPGVLLSPLKTTIKGLETSPGGLTDRPNFFRESDGTWHIFSTENEDNGTAEEIANRTKTPLIEVLTNMPNPIREHLPEKYAQYAIIRSQPRDDLSGSSRAILVSINGESDDGTIMVSRIHCVGAPCLLIPGTARILEPIFRYVTADEDPTDREDATPNDSGRAILEANPELINYLPATEDPAAAIESYVNLMRRGRLVANGQVLDGSQR